MMLEDLLAQVRLIKTDVEVLLQDVADFEDGTDLAKVNNDLQAALNSLNDAETSLERTAI